ncbi:MAG: hypothetical protein Q9M89_06295 [Persephonella sp.]|nr:hypothetical protein [Persephonella sp.]
MENRKFFFILLARIFVLQDFVVYLFIVWTVLMIQINNGEFFLRKCS